MYPPKRPDQPTAQSSMGQQNNQGQPPNGQPPQQGQDQGQGQGQGQNPFSAGWMPPGLVGNTHAQAMQHSHRWSNDPATNDLMNMLMQRRQRPMQMQGQPQGGPFGSGQ